MFLNFPLIRSALARTPSPSSRRFDHPLDEHRDARIHAALAASLDPTRGLSASLWGSPQASAGARPRRTA